MRKKIIRLTEKDLSNIVKMVLAEQSLDVSPKIKSCFVKHLKLPDDTKIPQSCLDFGQQVFDAKGNYREAMITLIFQKGEMYAKELAQAYNIDPIFVRSKLSIIGSCIRE